MVVLRQPVRKVYYLFMLTGLLFVFLLAACGGNASTPSKNSSAGASSPMPASTTANSGTAATIGATATSLMKMVSLIGQPSVKMLSTSTFEANGQVKNNDTAQHDITLKITLLDASGKVVGTATKLVDNVPGGQTASYVIQGPATQSTWTNVEVTVVKISENIPASGDN